MQLPCRAPTARIQEKKTLSTFYADEPLLVTWCNSVQAHAPQNITHALYLRYAPILQLLQLPVVFYQGRIVFLLFQQPPFSSRRLLHRLHHRSLGLISVLYFDI